MDYERFLQVAQAAIDSGCLILRRQRSKQIPVPYADISAVTPDCASYYFYLPELGDLVYKTDQQGNYYIDYGFNPLGLALIEAGFSPHPGKTARLYVMTGFYDRDGQWVPRSQRITKVYEKLARKARKLAQKVV